MSDQVVVLDESKMLPKILDFPNQLEKAWTTLWIKDLDIDPNSFDRVIVCGMGGSGIAGGLIRDFALGSSPKSIDVWQDYRLPNWVNEKSLVIIVSYSGETEEALDALSLALEKKAKIIGISSGGKLEAQSKIHAFLHVGINYQSQPREALGYLYGSLLTLLSKLGVIDLTEKNFFQAVAELKKTIEKKTFPEKAASLAMSLNNKIPLIFTYNPLLSVAKRWANQFNENSKVFALSAGSPELCHNIVVGLDFPAPEKLSVLFLESAFAFSRNIAREKVIQKLFQNKDIPLTPLSIRSGSLLAEQLLFLHFGDLLSYYLAGVYGIDPSPIESIKFLKDELRKI